MPPGGVYDVQGGVADQYYAGARPEYDCAQTEPCGPCAALGEQAESGTITLSSVTAGLVEGSYAFVDGLGDTITGTFSAPICNALDAGAARCCVLDGP
jgi:hypothetical protein